LSGLDVNNLSHGGCQSRWYAS